MTTPNDAPPRIGVDEWVARSGERRDRGSGPRASILRALERVGWWQRLAAIAAIVAIFPLLTSSDYAVRVGVNTLLLATLALGLNVVVGWTGLLDLGYVAFYGFGAYGFALLSSGQLGSAGIHLPSLLAILIVVVGAALLGLVLGLPSRRLQGDYLAIVTLFFGQIFVETVTNVAPKVTGGPNGVVGIDPLDFFGLEVTTTRGYFYVLLIVTVVIMGALHLIDSSRTGRGWRAVREDPLAAALMTIPVNRVKLLAFSVGAAVAALAGTIFAAFQAGAYPTDFDTPFLILVYAGVILGGSGSIAGAVLGATVVSVTLELLRNPSQAATLFYGLILLTLVVRVRPWRKLGAVLAALVAFGFAVHGIVSAISASAVAGHPQSGGWVGDALGSWVVVPGDPKGPGNIGFVVLVLGLVALVQLKGRARTVLLVPLLYLAAFVWETRLVAEASITRQILLGAILIVMMNARPQGLLGSKRVEVL
jgi:ABC-type branched-subunit amino acid transport system permease subunit